jgi:hypothetical protein
MARARIDATGDDPRQFHRGVALVPLDDPPELPGFQGYFLFVVEGIEASGCVMRRSCDSQLTPTTSGRGAEGLPAGNGDLKDGLTSVASVG